MASSRLGKLQDRKIELVLDLEQELNGNKNQLVINKLESQISEVNAKIDLTLRSLRKRKLKSIQSKRIKSPANKNKKNA